MSCKECCVPIEDCIATRRCFMTGEFCSKQMSIQQERNNLHRNNAINAFVIMNFSDMSDIVYKWHIRSFIESLNRYLYFEKDNGKAKRLYCYSETKDKQDTDDRKRLTRVEKINVVRSDTNPSSNFVMCSRVCQQLQIADLVVVDVSIENTNVFYELGMAAAMGKLILPICYSESFYKRELPKKLRKLMNNDFPKFETVEHHIGCCAWRKKLFEHFGIRYRRKACFQHANDQQTVDQSNGLTQYLDYETVIDAEYGFADRKYCMFPYNEQVKRTCGSYESEESIGEIVYNKLKDAYNNSTDEENTLVVYTMDGILNESEAGLCIVNYYSSIVERMKAEHCFCGDRVGVLVQSNFILDDDKDADEKKQVLYNVGEIIHIGMNQATYKAIKDTVTSKDYLYDDEKTQMSDSGEASQHCKDDIDRFTKDYVRNRCMMVFPSNPVYVKRIQNGTQEDIFERSCYTKENTHDKIDRFFCLYHVMLRTLKFTNEIVVDVSTNSIQALFWLGAAHGSDVYAISVRHEQTPEEKNKIGSAKQNERSIFDISGLWTAILHTYDIDGFYQQLMMAQIGIEQNARLLNKDNERYEDRLLDVLYKEDKGNTIEQRVSTIIQDKHNQTSSILERYYRKRFWSAMTKSNQLNVYFPQIEGSNVQDSGLDGHNAQWDVDAIGSISHYLSKRNIIGEYCFKSLGASEVDRRSMSINFICVGGAARPLPADEEDGRNQSLASYVNKRVVDEDKNKISEHLDEPIAHECLERPEFCHNRKVIYKGLRKIGTNERIVTQISQVSCNECLLNTERTIDKNQEWGEIITSDKCDDYKCRIKETGLCHTQLAQLLLWREQDVDERKGIHYWVSLSGVSGPSTLALASVLLDDEQHDDAGKGANSDLYPLTSLQEAIRTRIIDEYSKRLNNEVEATCKAIGNASGDQNEYYRNRVIYAATRYLSVTLYKYLLPFLSAEDESRICNGMRMYVFSMMAEGISPFARKESYDEFFLQLQPIPDDVVVQCAKHTYTVLKDVLESICGVEALFEVHVSVNEERMGEDNKSDARVIEEIMHLYRTKDGRVMKREEKKKDDGIYANCLFRMKRMDERHDAK